MNFDNVSTLVFSAFKKGIVEAFEIDASDLFICYSYSNSDNDHVVIWFNNDRKINSTEDRREIEILRAVVINDECLRKASTC